MKILHLLSTFGTGGIERWLLGLLPIMDLEKYQMEFFCRLPEKGILVDQVRSNGGIVHHHSGHKLNLFSYSNQLKELIRKNKYDIIHNHLAHHGGFPARIYSKIGVPSIVSFHNARLAPLQFGNPWKRSISKVYTKLSLKYLVGSGDIITGCSEDVTSNLEPVVSFQASDTRILHYGVDIPPQITEKEISDFKRSIEVNVEKKIIVHVGSFTPQKNHIGLLDIAKGILKNRTDVVFVLVGDGDLRSEVEKYAMDLGIYSDIRFLGLRNDVERIFSASDIFLFPSLYEGLPVACLEGLAAGLPVIGSNVPGIKLLVKNEVTGFLCEIEHKSCFVEKLILLLENPTLSKKIGALSKKFIQKNYSYEASTQKLIEMYEELYSKDDLKSSNIFGSKKSIRYD